jgi:hypothetical protein
MALIKHIKARYSTGQEVYVLYDDRTLMAQVYGGSASMRTGVKGATHRPVLRTRLELDIPPGETSEADISAWLVQMVRDEDTGLLVFPLPSGSQSP